MMRRLCLALLALMLAIPARAADTKAPLRAPSHLTRALRLVPKDASGIVVINDLRQIKNNLQQLETALKLPKQETSYTKQLFQQCPVEPAKIPGSIVGIFLEPRGERKPPGIVWVIVTDDYQQLLKKLNVNKSQKPEGIEEFKTRSGDKGLLAYRKGVVLFAPYSDDRASLRKVLKSKPRDARSLRVKEDWIKQWDVVGVATPEGWMNHLSHASSSARVKTIKRKDQPASRKDGRELNPETIIKKNLAEIALAARLEKDSSVHLGSRVFFRKDSAFAEAVKNVSGPEKAVDLWKDLPDQPYLLASGVKLPRKVQQRLMNEFLKSMRAEISRDKSTTEDVKKHADRLLNDLNALQKQVESTALVMRFQLFTPTKLWQLSCNGLMYVKDARSFGTKGNNWLAQMMSMAKKQKDSPAFNYKFKELNEGDFKGVLWSWYPTGKVAAGEGKRLRSYLAFGQLDAARVVFVFRVAPGAKEQAIRKTLKAYQNQNNRLAEDKGVQQAARLLPKTAHEVTFLNLTPTLYTMLDMLAEAEKANVQKSVPVACATTFFSKGVDMDVIVPIEMMQKIMSHLIGKGNPFDEK